MHYSSAILALLLQAASMRPATDSSAPAVIQRVRQGVVEIRAQGETDLVSGSGFIIRSDGVVATNVHVIARASKVAVRLESGEAFDQVSVLAYDAGRDLALLKIPGFNLPVLDLGDSDQVQPGQAVFALGHPLGLQDTVTKGIISGVRVLADGIKVIQTDAAASHGNSGGPLIAEDGKVLGVISFKLGGENLNFAIPINYVRGLAATSSSMTLAQFNQALAGQTQSLFSEEPGHSGVTGRWRSLQSPTTKVLRQDNEYIVGESLNEDGKAVGTYDLTRRPDGSYGGKFRGWFDCSYWALRAFPAEWRDNHCTQELELELTKIASKRIEGRIRAPKPPPGPDRSRKWADFCRTCGESEPLTWQSFTWVRVE